MLPTKEIDTLTMTVTNTIDFAAEGKVADGYAALVWGLHRAEEMVGSLNIRAWASSIRRPTMESEPPMTKRTKLLTSCARNDTAVGRFVGFLSALFLFGIPIDLAKRLLPAASYYKLLPLLWLLSALAVAALIVCILLWLRPRVPDFARGYRSGSLIVAIFFGVFCLQLCLRAALWWLL